jgi:hypothetical protein
MMSVVRHEQRKTDGTDGQEERSHIDGWGMMEVLQLDSEVKSK